MWPLVLVALALLIVLLALRGPPVLAKLEVTRGRVELTRGRLPGRLFDDFRDILADRSIERAQVRIVTEDGHPRLLARGLGEDHQQRLRNVLGPYTVAQLRAGQRRARK